jgi:hypothetical protein
MIRLYAKLDQSEFCVRVGRTFVDLAKAMDRAQKLKAVQVEVRDDSKPRSRNLLAVFSGGRRVAM